jgi:RHS repeat-associated protein
MEGMTPTASGSPRPDGGQFDCQRGTTLKYNLSNGRGDIVAQSDAAGALTWTASYEAYGKRTKETGANADKQRANSKDEDPTGLLNEGFRYRDLETGVWLSRDPAGFGDGPNLYAYVQQNPWSKFDAEGMFWSAIVTAGFAAYDTYQYATGQTSGAEYSKAMALNGAALLADVSTGGMGGGLALRALNAGVKVAKAVNKADTIYSTANGAIRTAEAIANGDGTGAVINGVLTAVGAKQSGRGGKAPDAPKVDAPGGKSAQSTNAEAQQIADASAPSSNLSPTNYPNPDPNMSVPAVRYDPETTDELMRMRSGQGPTTKATHGDQNIEAHHRQQVPMVNGGVMDEVTQQQHRGAGQHRRHSQPTQLTPKQRSSEIRDHWKQRSKKYVTDGEGI